MEKDLKKKELNENVRDGFESNLSACIETRIVSEIKFDQVCNISYGKKGLCPTISIWKLVERATVGHSEVDEREPGRGQRPRLS